NAERTLGSCLLSANMCLLHGDAEPVLSGVENKTSGLRLCVVAANFDNERARRNLHGDPFRLAIQPAIRPVYDVTIHIHKEQIEVVRIWILTRPQPGNIQTD